MNLYICEKPGQAAALAGCLKASRKGNGYFHDGGDVQVGWCQGHLLELFSPDEYSETLKKWDLNTLPIIPDPWQMKITKRTSALYRTLVPLIKKAKTVYIATDFDREGETICREVLERVGFKGRIYRVCMRGLDDHSIYEALDNIKEGYDTVNLHHSADSRRRADWLIGMNMTRLFSVLADQAGVRTTMNIGRVLSPLVNLVVQRDLSIKNFEPSPFYNLNAEVSVQHGSFNAKWIPPTECSDDEGRCINPVFAQQVANQIQGKNGIISHAEKKRVNESAPLPFHLNSLQQYASKRWGYTAQETLDITQSLYENHKCVSYPRTDSRYLPVSQFSEAAPIMQALMLVDDSISTLVAGADTSRMGRAFNDDKFDAHHGIIPTRQQIKLTDLNDKERNIYDAIRRFYIAQFYSPAEVAKTHIVVDCEGHKFEARGKTPLVSGWKIIFQSEAEVNPKDENEIDEDEAVKNLPKVNQNEACFISKSDIANKMTKPAPHFTEATLLAAMANIARFVDEPNFKKILKETSGLGTEATRAGILDGAVKRGFLNRQKKLLLATEKAFGLMKVLPDVIASPGMTAAWEQDLDRVASGELNALVFQKNIERFVSKITNEYKEKAAAGDNGAMKEALSDVSSDSSIKEEACFVCGGPMRLRKGQYGKFWGCMSKSCNKTFKDNRGKPMNPADEPESPPCPKCSGPMKIRKGKAKDAKRATQFWGCADFPKCNGIISKVEKKTKAKAKSAGEPKSKAPKKTYTPSPSVTPSEDGSMKCPDCGSAMKVRNGKSGEFWGCSGFPKCKKTMSKS